MSSPIFLSLLLVLVEVNGEQKCIGTPRKYQGKICASTTRYSDNHKGACGCGPNNIDTQYWWIHDHYVAAPNQMYFDSSNGTWCGSACGKCVNLTTTGGYVTNEGGPARAGHSVVFMVTNVCPVVQYWCNQNIGPYGGGHNEYGYALHFDLENGAGQISALGWDNPGVTWEEVDCSSVSGKTPTRKMFQQCYCSHHGHLPWNDMTFS